MPTMESVHKLAPVIAVMAVLAAPVQGQQDLTVAGETEAYLRLLQINGQATGLPLAYRSLSSLRHARIHGEHPWSAHRVLRADSARSFRILPAEGRTVFNSRYPRGINDGALWAGRGFSLAVSGGVAAAAGGFSVLVYPTLLAEQNRGFDTITVTSPEYSPLSYPWRVGSIDWPQQMGSKGRVLLDPGQSGIRLDIRSFTVGVSTENMVWGPSVLNPIVMSATGPGFPHADLGLGRPVNTPIGKFEGRLVWGRLAESGWFDTISTNNYRLLTGIVVGWEPRWIPGLHLGVDRVLYTYWDGSLRVVDFVDVFQPFFKRALRTPSDPEGSDDRDQLFSLFARWVLPESGFEAYLEWARNDHSLDLRDLTLEPDHSQTWSAGFQKSFLSDAAARTRVRGEVNHLGRSPTFQVRATPTLYQHYIVRHGYTHRGQLVGAGIGGGSDSQYLAVDRFTAGGRWGFFLQRVRYDDDAYYVLFGAERRRDGHNVEVTGGVSLLRWVGDLRLGFTLAVNREINRHYTIDENTTNLHAVLTLGWLEAPGRPTR